MHCRRGLTRRDFLRTTAAAAGAVLAGPAAFAQSTPDKSRVIIARNGAVTKGGEIVEDVLARMVDAAVTALTGEADAAKAWGKLFSTDETIGLKPNGLGGPMLSTATALIKVCVERLQGIGVPSEKIIIWERSPADFVVCGLDVSEKAWGATCIPSDAGFDEPVTSGAFTGRLAQVVTKRIDAYIDLPIIKDHNIAGVTGALKSVFGSVMEPGQYHVPGCDPHIADIYSLPPFRGKSRLIVTDGTRATCEGGPQFNPLFAWNANLILAATDPVANDAQIWKIVDAQREANGLMPLEAVGRKPKSILTAAERGLGNADEARIEVEELAPA